jgi:hypothetical protein
LIGAAGEVAMFLRTPPIVAAVVSALLACSVATTATAARSDHPKKKTHAAKAVTKSATKPTAPEPALGPRPPGM